MLLKSFAALRINNHLGTLKDLKNHHNDDENID